MLPLSPSVINITINVEPEMNVPEGDVVSVCLTLRDAIDRPVQANISTVETGSASGKLQ
jgi:hypothetical protein